MKCQKCKVNDATTHIKRIVNGKYTEYILCADCAHEMGFDNVFDTSMPDMFGGLLTSIFGAALPSRSQATRCPVCSSTYGDIKNTGKVGCASCYDIFLQELLPSIKGIHGNTQHCGKVSEGVCSEVNASEQKSTELTVEELKAELQNAIKEQNFELAAELRDKIKEREGA
ncbi:MAG: hypothetical protein E7566_02670 [Ruminococcaceae bacterium]|nr:hypothetical protein [Oscillospiraceae bacterium]